MPDLHNRRAFLRAALAASTAWAAIDVLQVEDALAWASEQTAGHAAPATAAAFRILTPAQVQAFEALTARILPAVDGRPGAREAGVVYFIERALATFAASDRRLYTDGLANLNQRAVRKAAGVTGFVGLSPAQQDELLHDIEQTPFFQTVRFATIVGTFALPTYGGNRDYAGWHLIGLDHQPRFQAPFGFYDADANRRG